MEEEPAAGLAMTGGKEEGPTGCKHCDAQALKSWLPTARATTDESRCQADAAMAAESFPERNASWRTRLRIRRCPAWFMAR